MIAALFRTLAEGIAAWLIVMFVLFSLLTELPRPAPAQDYSDWITRAFALDFGESATFRRPVNELLSERAAATVELFGLAVIVALFALLIAQVRRDVAVARSLTASIPFFWWALVLILILGLQVSAFPASGRMRLSLTGGTPPLTGRLEYLVLPGLTLLVYLQGRFLLALRGRERGWRAAARAFADELPGLIAAIIVVEVIFAWPGIGRLLIDALTTLDSPMIGGATVVLSTVTIAAGLIPRFLSQIPARPSDPAVAAVPPDAPTLRTYRPLLIVLGILALFAVFTGVLIGMAGLDPFALDVSTALLPPGASADGTVYLLGTDELGRNFTVRLLAGAQESVFVALVAGLAAVIGGTILGRALPAQIVRSLAYVNAFVCFFPLVLLALMWHRPSRENMIVLLALPFIVPAAALLYREPLERLIPVWALTAAQVLLLEGLVSFLGIGFRLSLGGLLTAAQSFLINGTHLVILPGLTFMVISFFLLVFSYRHLPQKPLHQDGG